MSLTRQIKSAPDQAATRERLLEIAGEVFAEQGFRNATVREICHRAGANIASINYHFGDKERLYGEVMRDTHRAAMSKYPPDLGVAPDAPAPLRLHAFVRSFLLRIFDDGRPAWHGKLIAREIADPTPALEKMVDEGVRPNFLAIRSIVTELLGGSPPPERVRYCAWSVVAQCLFYFYARPVITRIHPSQSFAVDEIERIARHITDFSLAAMKAERARTAKAGRA
jgi:AcrR family transcriptional regulator